MTLQYTATVDATSSAGVVAARRYALNDVYDPDITGTGSQPLGFDEWTSIYTRFVVVSSKIEVISTSRTVSGRLSIAVFPVSVSTVYPIDYVSGSEMRYARTCATTGGGPSPRIIIKKTTASIMGVPDYAIQSDVDYSGTSAQTPNRLAAWVITGETSGASDAYSLTVRLSYKVRFWIPKIVSTSISLRSPAAAAAQSEPEPDNTPVVKSTADESQPAKGIVVDRQRLEDLRSLLADLRAQPLRERDWDGYPLPSL